MHHSAPAISLRNCEPYTSAPVRFTTIAIRRHAIAAHVQGTMVDRVLTRPEGADGRALYLRIHCDRRWRLTSDKRLGQPCVSACKLYLMPHDQCRGARTVLLHSCAFPVELAVRHRKAQHHFHPNKFLSYVIPLKLCSEVYRWLDIWQTSLIKRFEFHCCRSLRSRDS